MSQGEDAVEVRPRGYPRPTRGELAAFGVFAALFVASLAQVVQEARAPGASWEARLGTVSVTRRATLPSGGFTVQISTGPNPVMWLLVLASGELYRVAYRRSYRYRLDGSGRLEASRGVLWRRRSEETVAAGTRIEPARGGVWLKSPDGEGRWLRGLDAVDAEALRGVLAERS